MQSSFSVLILFNLTVTFDKDDHPLILEIYVHLDSDLPRLKVPSGYSLSVSIGGSS